MPIFTYSFSIDAPLSDVAEFHRDTRVLRKLSPMPMQLHRVDPMGEGSVSEFTMWLGPIPIRWRAVHSNISKSGFTDTQESGPMEFWAHTHRFEAISGSQTRIHEHVEYRHPKGFRGLLTRLLFGKLGLFALFTFRKFSTRFALRRAQ